MATHVLKTDPAVFDAVYHGAKTYEIRFNDRNFRPLDTLVLKETAHTGEAMRAGAPLVYTGRQCTEDVAHVLQGPLYGLVEGWCILSFVRPFYPRMFTATSEGRTQE